MRRQFNDGTHSACGVFDHSHDRRVDHRSNSGLFNRERDIDRRRDLELD
jgi:hypothetical protein